MWATATRCNINEPAFYVATTKEDTALKKNPGTAVADYDSCDRGETPLSYLESTTTNRVNQNLLQEARELAKDNMTPADWLTILAPSKKGWHPSFPLGLHCAL